MISFVPANRRRRYKHVFMNTNQNICCFCFVSVLELKTIHFQISMIHLNNSIKSNENCSVFYFLFQEKIQNDFIFMLKECLLLMSHSSFYASLTHFAQI
uniref:Ovule protein n=1 Tax=Caenorhabditis tropicalis TaxID=1561998 RepID=A0A1I7TFH6_9PELO